jgi:hypothetical protein
MSILQHTKTEKTKGFHYHHITPKHLGGTDDKDNLVLLSPIEHAQAHLELFKKYGKQADAWAYNRLMRQIGLPHKSLFIAPNKGKKFSPEVNAKKGKCGEQNAMKRTDVKEKHRLAMLKLRGTEKVKNFGLKNSSSKPITINGFYFDTIANASKYYNVGRDTVRGWLNGVKPQQKFNILTIKYVDKS